MKAHDKNLNLSHFQNLPAPVGRSHFPLARRGGENGGGQGRPETGSLLLLGLFVGVLRRKGQRLRYIGKRARGQRGGERGRRESDSFGKCVVGGVCVLGVCVCESCRGT